MTTTYKNPFLYLNDLLSKKGKSGANGVYATNISVVADAMTDYGYKINPIGCSPSCNPYNLDRTEWLELLVSLRVDSPQTPLSVVSHNLDKGVYQFVPEGGNISMNVFLPELNIEMFESYVVECQDMLNCVANFVGKMPTHVRFQIGYVSKDWEDLAEDGEVEEQDFTF